MIEEHGIIFDVELHDAQMEVWESDARFKVVACGRRFGKTFLGVNMMIAAAIQKPFSVNWWVAPIYDQTDVAFRFFLDAIPEHLVHVNKTKKTAVLWNGAICAFKTAKDPDSLRAEGLDFLALDEAAFQKREVWFSVLRPALADKKGTAVLIGTFDGENWFYDMYLAGQLEGPDEFGDFDEYESWRFPSEANPFLDPIEIEHARLTTPKAEFEQEWLANPLIYVGSVFDGETVQAAIEAGINAEFEPEHETFLAIDWGYTNPTVVLVIQEHPTTNEITHVEEHTWYTTKLETRLERIVDLVKQHRAIGIYADAAGKDENVSLAAAVEDAIARDQELAGLDTRVVAVRFSEYKESGIKTRRWYLEQGLERIGPNCRELARTTKRYHYKEDSEDVVKEDDHHVDAATAFYASRRGRLVQERGAEIEPRDGPYGASGQIKPKDWSGERSHRGVYRP